MNVTGKYIYGIIASEGQQPYGPYGITSCKEVHIIPYKGIAAVVRDAQIVDYTRMFKDALAMLLVEHQKTIERIMNLEYTVIPMCLGTFAKDEAEVREILSKGYVLINEIIQKTIYKIEIDVAATWNNFNAMVKEASEEREIKEFKENLLTDPKGITVDGQLKIGFMLKKALEKKRDEYALKIQEALKRVSFDFKTHELMDDKMVINAAFLIDKNKRGDFDKKIEGLNVEFNEKLNFRCVGPLPLYSFYTLQIKKIQSQDLDWAKKKLHLLSDFTNRDELKEIYQRALFLYHPDKNPTKPGTEKEFAEVVKAYKLLGEYCIACEQAGYKDRFPFVEEEFRKNTLLLKVKD